MLTFTGWKNSSITFCALESSEDEHTPEGAKVVVDWLLTPELLGAGACRLGCLLWGPLGDLNNLQVKIIATANPARAPTDRESWYQLNEMRKPRL